MKDTATIKLVLDNKDKSDKKLLKVRITYRRIPHTYTAGTDIKLTEEEFLNDRLKITKEAKEAAEKALSIASAIVKDLGTNFTFQAFAKKYRAELFGEHGNTSIFSTFAEAYINNLSAENTKGSYRTACRWLNKYRKGARVSDINKEFVSGFIEFIKKEREKEGFDTSDNTIRIYLRSIKAIYNNAVQTLGIPDTSPFTDIKTRSIKRQKYALDTERLSQVINYEPSNQKEQIGKDFFILTFSLSGANFGDILSLKNKNIDLDKEQVSFTREKTKKTGVEIIVPLTSDALVIMNKYGSINPKKPNDYIFPYLSFCSSEKSIRNKISDLLKKVNKGLSLIAEALSLGKITTYTARHSYVNIAVQNGHLTRDQIQKFLGWTNSSTAEFYLGSITTESIETNRDYIETILRGGNRKKRL